MEGAGDRDGSTGPDGARGGARDAAVVRVAGVRKRHRRSAPWVLDGIDLQVDRGRIVQVVGTNGSGKSTLVRIVGGLARPTEGSVRVVGSVTFVPEQTPPPVPMTPRLYLHHQARLQGVATRARTAAVDTAIERHRLGPVADRPLRELSKGWTQRTLIAQALVSSPSLCLLDEPFTGVDMASRDHLLGVIEEHASAGVSFVITSHEAMAIHGLDQVHLSGGRLVALEPDEQGAERARPLAVRLVDLRLQDAQAPRGDGAASPDDRQAALLADPVVHRGDVRPDGVVALVIEADARGDRFLATALADGWTIERLETRYAP